MARDSFNRKLFGGYSGCGPIPAQCVTLLADAENVAQHLARTVFASTWADAVERERETRRNAARDNGEGTYDVSDLPNLSGCDVLEHAPHDAAPLRFLAYGRDAVATSIALAFAEVDGAKILAQWDETGAEELGHALALQFMGTGAVDDEELGGESIAQALPTWDADGRVYLSLSELDKPRDPTDADLRKLRNVRGEPLTDAQRGQIAQWIEDSEARVSEVLDNVSELLGYGDVQSIELPDDEDTRLEYVNTGDTYADTLTHDGARFAVASWGDALERAEESRTFETGETRCAHCGEWSATLLGGKACEHCGNTN